MLAQLPFHHRNNAGASMVSHRGLDIHLGKICFARENYIRSRTYDIHPTMPDTHDCIAFSMIQRIQTDIDEVSCLGFSFCHLARLRSCRPPISAAVSPSADWFIPDISLQAIAVAIATRQGSAPYKCRQLMVAYVRHVAFALSM